MKKTLVYTVTFLLLFFFVEHLILTNYCQAQIENPTIDTSSTNPDSTNDPILTNIDVTPSSNNEPVILPLPDTIISTKENECTKGLELIVQVEDSPEENVLTRNDGTVSIQDIPGCPFQSPQIVSEKVKRTTIINKAGCVEEAYPAEEDLHIKNLITDYYQGGPESSSAGLQLCDLLEGEPTLLDNRLISIFEDELGTEQAPPPPPPLTFLNSEERDKLVFKWSRWNDAETAPFGQSRSDGVTVYAASRQNESSHFSEVPSRVTLQEMIGEGPMATTRVINYEIGRDIIMITPNPESALTDLMGNVYADYENLDGPNMNGMDGRALSGTLPFDFGLTVYVDINMDGMFVPVMVTNYMPFYHATFLSHYTAGLAYKITTLPMADMNSLDLAHTSLLSGTEWSTFRRKYLSSMLFPVLPNDQTPIKSPWDPNPSFVRLTDAQVTAMSVERYALLIRSSEEEKPSDIYTFNADINLIRHLLVTPAYNYGIQAGNIFIASTENEITNRIARIQERARTAKAASPPKTTQLLIYVAGHGVTFVNELTDPENAINNIENKEGGKVLLVHLEERLGPAITQDVSLDEMYLKSIVQDELQSPSDAQKNVIDNTFVIIETCDSGAGVT